MGAAEKLKNIATIHSWISSDNSKIGCSHERTWRREPVKVPVNHSVKPVCASVPEVSEKRYAVKTNVHFYVFTGSHPMPFTLERSVKRLIYNLRIF